MRYAIVSDIHANLPAWKAVLADIADLKADKIVCLGDIVGYGTDPVGVLESVYHVVHAAVLGNHDAAVCGKLDPDTFTPRARTAVLRHREQISARGLAWLGSLPLVLKAPGFQCAHGDFSAPAAFRYIVEPGDAVASWSCAQEQLLFVGHSHLPGIYVTGSSGVPHFVNACDFTLEAGKRYIVNPGSVGYPRVGDCRSSYCVYDDGAKTLTFRTLPFDCAGYRKGLREAGFPDDPWIEEKESASNLPALRARLCFAKPLTADQHARNVRQQSRLGARRTRGGLFFALLLAGCAAGAAGFAWLRAERANVRSALPVCVPDYDLPSLNAYPLLPADRNLLPPLPAFVAPGERLAGWRYALESRDRQSLGTGLRDGAISLRITHRGAAGIRLDSPLINLAGTGLRTLRVRGKLRREEGVAGTAFFQIITYATLPDQTQEPRTTISHEIRGGRGAAAGHGALNRKITLPRNTTHVRFRMEAEFDGVLELEQPSLTPADEAPRAVATTRKGSS